MGGELRAATSAAMVEKLFKPRQRWYSMSVYDFKCLEHTNLRRDDKILNDQGTLPWIILHKDRVSRPIGDLHHHACKYKTKTKDEWGSYLVIQGNN